MSNTNLQTVTQTACEISCEDILLVNNKRKRFYPKLHWTEKSFKLRILVTELIVIASYVAICV